MAEEVSFQTLAANGCIKDKKKGAPVPNWALLVRLL
jgi:hypothetical protein